MPIRRILLISFLLLLLVVALPLTALSFIGSKNSLQREIGRNLSSDAEMLMERIDMLMFERMQNVHSWSHLDIIQEARVGDVDKRLSHFLADVGAGYKGMYRDLFYVDAQQRVISASSPDLIGSVHDISAHGVMAEVPNGEVGIEALQLSPPYDNDSLLIRAPIHDHYAAHTHDETHPIGYLYGLFDMRQLFRLLDKASKSSAGERYLVLLDGEGRTIAASASLRKPTILLTPTFAAWKPDQPANFFIHDGQPVTDSQVLVGYAKSTGYMGFAQMGWSILIIQSTDKAFIPINALLEIFAINILLMMLMGFSASHLISGWLAKPLLELTQWVRTVGNLTQSPPPNVDGTREIHELKTAFSDMLHELELSREHVIQATKLAVVGEMAAIMAHEVRTPLGILSTSAQWLQGEQGLSPEGKEMTHFILEESARLKKLVTTLLECARPREPKMQVQNIHELITHALELLATQTHKKHLHIELQLHAVNPYIACDNELLTQVLLNLLLNAIQILPNNGIIWVRTVAEAQHLRIEIADNGSGIAVDDYPRLFDPFFTKREGGVGLGLTVTQQIILAHHGKIFAQPHDGGGACFVIILPMNQG